MAYPTVSAAYGFKPVGLIGGRPYAGSTRMISIAEAYGQNIFNGDLVDMSAGTLIKSALAYNTSNPTAGHVGVFVGTEYSLVGGPLFGKNRYQYWPASTVSQDAVGYVIDDPNAVFRVACLAQSSAGASNSLTTVGYVSQAYVGTNLQVVANGTGSTATGDSLAGVSSSAAPSNGLGIVRTTAAANGSFRVVQLVPDTAVVLTGSGTISSTTLTLSAAVTGLQAGMQLIVSNVAGTGYTTGGFPGDYNYVTNVNGTTVTIASAITAATAVNISFVGYPEVIVAWNAGNHAYNNSTGV
jgi:hypothetical protein